MDAFKIDKKPYLNIIDPFNSPIELWKTREPSAEELKVLLKNNEWKPFCKINVEKEVTINSSFDAAKLVAGDKNESRIDKHVILYLSKSQEFKKWRTAMPHPTPQALVEYQEKYRSTNFDLINLLVSEHGMIIPEGQVLFHGGVWPRDANGEQLKAFITTRALSTSFCPKVALNNGEWLGKAYDAGHIDLMVINVKSMSKKAFIFPIDSGSNSHEMEVLFESGIQMNLISTLKANLNFTTCKSTNMSDLQCKKIQANVILVEMNHI